MTFASSFPIQLFASALVGDQQYPMGSHITTSETLKIICDFVILEEEKVGLEQIEVLINGKVKAIKKLRDVSNADLTAVTQSTARCTRPESGRINIDINWPNNPSSPGYIYLRIFGYKARQTNSQTYLCRTILFKVTKDCSGVVYLKNGRTP